MCFLYACLLTFYVSTRTYILCTHEQPDDNDNIQHWAQLHTEVRFAWRFKGRGNIIFLDPIGSLVSTLLVS